MKLIVKIAGVMNRLKGGAGDTHLTSDFDQAELAKGIKHELEHTKDEELAREIAMDHLSEDPHYYTNLLAAGIKQ